MGGKIYVTEGMPGMNFDVTPQRFSRLSEDSQVLLIKMVFIPFLISISESIMYPIYMEDHFLQESTFRPESNATHVLKRLYGRMPTLTLVSNQFGPQSQRWSGALNQTVGPPGYQMKLEGMGAGFKYGSSTPELFITPGPENKG